MTNATISEEKIERLAEEATTSPDWPELLVEIAEACAELERDGSFDLVRRNREVFRLHHTEGLTRTAIAKRLGMAWRTVDQVLTDWVGCFEDYEPRRPKQQGLTKAERYAEVVRLRQQGLSFRGIAKRTGVPAMTAHGIVKRSA